MKLNSQNKALLALFASAMLFGSTFLVVKNLLDDLSPMFVVFCRFLIASIFFLIIGGIPNKNSIKPGLIMGFFLWLGYYTQTEGLVTSSTINSGVVTGFYLVLNPHFSNLINQNEHQKKNYLF
jgi:drug/metabolite transporter (DMT)-like permease